MSEGFFTNLQTAEFFFRICRMYHITDLKDRIALMRKIVARGKARYIRDPETFLKGKKVLRLRGDYDNESK